MKTLRLMFILLLPLLSFAQETSKTVIAEGQGRTRDIALDQAKRTAVEMGLGTVVAGQTISKNFQLASDVILNRANGFVKKYREIAYNESAGICTIKIEAEVTQIFNEILKDQQAIDLLMEWMDKPRVMIWVEETNIDQNTSACETEMARKLNIWHFNLVSRKTMEEVGIENANTKSGLEKIALSAFQKGAELLVLGKASAQEKSGLEYLQGTGMKSVQADFSGQIVEASSGKILASCTTHGAAVHISPISAGMEALTKASCMMTDSLVAALLRNAGEAQVSSREITLEISGIGYSAMNELKKKMYDIGGVAGVNQRSFQNGTGVLVFEYYGKSEDFAADADGLKLTDGKIIVQEIFGNKVKVKFVSK